MSERDKFLTEAMGECLHENGEIDIEDMTVCPNCFCDPHWNDFSTWEGYGKLSQFMAGEKLNTEFFKWYQRVVCNGHTDYYRTWIESTPNYCSNAIYAFLKERNP